MTVIADPRPPPPVDVVHHAHLSGVFAPQREEVDVADLPVAGEIPDDVHGTYLRNGPNPRFDPIGSFKYPLDGDGMVHRITFAGGCASYSNRFVRTPMVELEERRGEAVWSGLLDGYTPPVEVVGSELANTPRQLPDINIVQHAGRLMAMAESDKPYRLDRESLATLGTEDCGGAMLVGSTAHPKIDPRTGELVLFNYSLESPYLTWSVVGADGNTSRTPTPVDGLDVPIMIHDMALTQKYVVLFANPLVFDIEAMMRRGSMLSWQPDRGTRIALIPRDGSAVRWIDTDPFWVWHFANAFDNPDGTVTVDYVEHAIPLGFAQPVDGSPAPGLARATCDPASGSINRDRISDRPGLEFPRIDDRVLTREHRHIATVGKAGGDHDELDSLWFHDCSTGADSCFTPGVAIGEPIHIPGERNDYWGAIGTDPSDMRSRFYLLDAADPADGPIATIDLPIRVPAGLHGTWSAD
ncbi:MAG: carotenoid oxygenase family protein [Rhodococcus sp. (in: high G+C Gram-positive bacteria)]